MGGKSSKPQQPRKSFSTIGRSSQRSKYQKSRVQLNQVNKTLKGLSSGDASSTASTTEQVCVDIRQKLNSLREELTKDADKVKEYNKSKYDEILKYLEETENVLASIWHSDGVDEVQENVIKQKSLQENNNGSVVKSEVEEEVEIRRSRDENEPVGGVTRPFSNSTTSGVKFGVQVMPTVLPKLSQRSTLPSSPVAKREFQSLRKTFPVDHSSSEALAKLPYSGGTALDKNTSLSTEFLSFLKNPLQEDDTVQTEALEQIELIGQDVSRLEKRLLYFRGTKGDSDYFQLHEQFIRNLIDLDNIEAYGNAIVRLEKKNVIQRIRELINILKKLVENDEEVDL